MNSPRTTKEQVIDFAGDEPEEQDKRDAERWRRLVNASELPFPVATISDDPENDARMLYGRARLESYIDLLDEIPNSYEVAEE